MMGRRYFARYGKCWYFVIVYENYDGTYDKDDAVRNRIGFNHKGVFVQLGTLFLAVCREMDYTIGPPHLKFSLKWAKPDYFLFLWRVA